MREDYLAFIHDRFPKTKQNRFEHCLKIYDSIIKSNLFYKAYRPLLSGRQDNIFLFDYFQKSLISILLVLPLNDDQLISFRLRSATEYLLKFLYSIIFPDIKMDKVENIMYRNINSDIKDKTTKAFKSKVEMDELHKLYSIYGSSSIKIHSKGDIESEVEFITEILDGNIILYKKYDKILNELTESTYIFLSSLFSINLSDFSHPSKYIIKSIDGIEGNRIFQYLKDKS